MHKITMNIGVRWWLKPWLCLALAINHTTGWRPTEAHIHAVARRAVYIKVIK